MHRTQNLAVFPEEDDNPAVREAYADDNLKVNEFLYRRVDITDVVAAQLLASQHAPAIGFRKYVISATTPFLQEDLPSITGRCPAGVAAARSRI